MSASDYADRVRAHVAQLRKLLLQFVPDGQLKRNALITVQSLEEATLGKAPTAEKRALLLAELKSYAEPPYPHQQLDSGFGMSPVPQREGYRPDPDSTHSRADRILLELIDDEEITAAFVAIRRWYA